MTSGPAFSWKHWPAFATVLAVSKKDGLLSIHPSLGLAVHQGPVRMLRSV